MPKQHKILTVEIPPESFKSANLFRIDYKDCFLITVYKRDVSAQDVARNFFLMAPAWIVNLMKFRDVIVANIGLKSHSEIEKRNDPKVSKFEVGEAFGLFHIKGHTENEIVIGADDKHLNFRVSLLVQKQDNSRTLIYVSTIGMLHNKFGRFYMKLVAPFHKLVVPSMLNGIRKGLLADKLDNNEQ